MIRSRFLVIGWIIDGSDIVDSFRRRAAAFECSARVRGYDRVEVIDQMARRGAYCRWDGSGNPKEVKA